MPKNEPLVSVLLPFVRVDDFLQQATQSILQQEHFNLELLLLDNQNICQPANFFATDPRITVINCRGTKSLSRVLNSGVSVSKGVYIARMDADDISDKTRIRKQVKFLEANKNIGVIGSAIQVINELGSLVELRVQPSLHEDIVKKLATNNPFFHPTVMFRKEVIENIKGPYNPKFKRSQDYELWTRLLLVARGGNIDEPLVIYRLHPGQFGRQIPHQSVFYFRLAQIKYSVNCAFKKENGLGWRVILINFKNFLVVIPKFILSIVNIKLCGFKRKIQQIGF